MLKRGKRRSVSGRRFVVTVAALALVMLVGVGGVIAGVVVQMTPEQRDAQPLVVGDAFTVPDRPPFSGDMVVYGSPPEGERPDLDELGCQVTDGGGPLSAERALREDRIVVQDEGLVPLVSFPGQAGHSIACTGPAAQAAAPLYVIPGANNRSLIPLAGYSLAVLCIPLAALGLVYARWSRV